MKVLIVTNVYPTKEHPYHGIFVKEQVEAVKQLHPDVDFDILFTGFGGKKKYFKSIWSASKQINKGNYDLVHIHYGLAGIYLFWPFVKKVKTLVTFHGSDIQPKGDNSKLSLVVSRHTAKKADAAIVLNEEMNEIVRQYCSKTYMIPCAVDVNTFCPMEKTEKHDKVQIVFPSNHERQVKNYPLFCDVLSILKEKFGIEAEEREMKNMTRKEIAQLYSNADLLLMTSKSEGSPQAVKEAMACNLPCVSTPVGDVGVLLSGVKDSYVAENHEAEELASLVNMSLKHEKTGVQGRERLIDLGIDSVTVADKIYALYRELAGNRI